MAQDLYDALIIGGGPGGSTAASLLAREGKRVLLLERERFPRFHIGESLLPYNRRLYEELGVLPEIEKAGFIRKHGAQFYVGNGSKCLKVLFRRGVFTRETMAIQVERSRFDHILLQHAAKTGAEVREGVSVTRFRNDSPDQVEIETADESGATTNFHGRFLIDASGRANLTGNQQRLRVMNPKLKKVALFGHFEGVRLDEGESGGDTIIIRLEDKWFWIIPISAAKTSVGCVMDQSEFASRKQTPAELFLAICESSSVLRERMKSAHALTPIHTTGDFSYRNKRFIDRRLIRVGDAAGFMDPIFSAGVYLAMYSAKMASEVVLQSLAEGEDGWSRFPSYEGKLNKAMLLYWEMVEGFYSKPWLDLFFEGRSRMQIQSAVTALLAGELDGSWRIRWRMRLFFWLVRLHSLRPIVPSIHFEEPSESGVVSREQEPDVAMV